MNCAINQVEPPVQTAETRTCYRCKETKLVDLFSKGRNPNSPECKECHNARSRVHRAKPETKRAQSEYHRKKRIADIERRGGNFQEIVQTCHACGFSGLSRHFVEDKAKPSGHSNACLACERDRSKKWKDNNRLIVRQQNREYKIRNREKVNAYARSRLSNPQVKLHSSVRKRISETLRGQKRSLRSLELLGVASIDDYKLYLENLFELGMSWENYGNGLDKWNIDHKKPLFRFDLTDPAQLVKAFHFSNTRPMWQSENGTNGAIARWRREGN